MEPVVYDEKALTALGRRRAKRREEEKQDRPKLHALVLAADAAEVEMNEIARQAGMTRDGVLKLLKHYGRPARGGVAAG